MSFAELFTGNTRLDSGVKPPSPPNELRNLGEYRLLRRLGEGGMGEVYLGFSERLGQQVAVKILADHLSGVQSYVDRFYREAKSGALLNHPNIVRSVTSGRDQTTGKHYLVLEYVEGFSAHALLDQQGKLDVGDAVHIALDVARALEHAHSRNVVHRDIKPDNILLSLSGVSKLVDFGLAKRTDETNHLTATNQGFGTTPYMPYEQAINAKYADGRSDIYALGATLYHLLTGAVPFPGDNHLDIVQSKERGEFDPPSALNADVPPELDRVLCRMMARDPRHRYQTASELIVDLERTNLAARVPRFADPERARNDPWMQTYLASTAEPTRPDLDSAQLRPSPTPTSDKWIVRVRGQSGAWRKYKATTQQIIQRLHSGKMPAEVEAGQVGAEFHPLSHYPAFQEILPALKANHSLREKARQGKNASKPALAAASRLALYIWITGGALAALLIGCGLLLYIMTR